MSFDDPFQYFELKRKDATSADVKRAYAKKLKVTRPDDDPAEFMRLRQNFEAALNAIKWRDHDRANGYEDPYEDEEDDNGAGSSDAQPISDQLQQEPSQAIEAPVEPQPSSLTPTGAEWAEPEARTEEHHAPPEHVTPPPSGADWAEQTYEDLEDDTPPEPVAQPWGFTPDDQELVKKSIEQIYQLMDDADRRSKWSAWLAIIDNEHLEGIDTFQMLSYRLRNVICQETSPEQGRTVATLTDRISPDILLHLDDRFGWSKQTGTDWVTRNENLWISRLVETAAIATGRTSITPWEKAQRELAEKSESAKPSRFSEDTRNQVAIGWIVARIFLIIVLINFIGYLLRD